MSFGTSAAAPAGTRTETLITRERRRNPAQALWQAARSKPLGAVSAVLLMALVLVAFFAPVIAPYDPVKPNGLVTRHKPSASHIFGTDQVGRDILSRVVYGARPSLEVGLISVIAATLVGSMLGLISGFFRGLADVLIQRLMDAVLSIPPLVLAVAVAAVLGIGLRNTIIAIAIVFTPASARIVRGAALAVREQQFIEAARTTGGTDWHIIVRHILPNVAAPIIVIASIQIGGAILAEAALSFLGLGTQVPKPSWGADMAAARSVVVIAVWISLFPGLAISLTVLSCNLLGDALRDLLDPRLRRAT